MTLWTTHPLDDVHTFRSARLPQSLVVSGEAFERLWDLHPATFHAIVMVGRPVETPRWQQAYGRDYCYTGQVNTALAVPDLLEGYRSWAVAEVDPRLNGLLLNWYDGEQGHYIGPHHDSTKGMCPGAPIVTVSLGEERIFRFRHPKTRATVDTPVGAGSVVVVPFETNLAWKHEVPRFARWKGRRISITLRAFV